MGAAIPPAIDDRAADCLRGGVPPNSGRSKRASRADVTFLAASPDRGEVPMEILNLDCFSGEKGEFWRNKALGFSTKDDIGDFNGGVVNPMREHLKLGQYYFRFASSSWPRPAKVAGAWWIDYDTLNTIHNRYKAIGASTTARHIGGSGPAASTFREWLAVTYEWNLFQEIVVARLLQRLDAYSGAGRTAHGGHVFDNRSFGYAPHLSNLFTIKQYCVPDLRVHGDKAFPNIKIIPFREIENLANGVGI
jgi:hypothetical protein